jgi:RNA polymerase sigma factor (sigma-70 family)
MRSRRVRPAALNKRPPARLSLVVMEEEQDLEALYRERYVGFRNALAPLVGSREAARDVVQEAFAQALRHRRKLRRNESLAPWVWRIAYRIALRERGRPKDLELPEDLAVLDSGRDPALAAALRSLPPKRRMVLFLRYYADFSYSEIAEALGITVGTVGATLAQAQAALLDELTPKEVTR